MNYDKAVVGQTVRSLSLQEIGEVMAVCDGALLIRLLSGEKVWAKAHVVYRIDGNQVQLECELAGLHHYRDDAHSSEVRDP